MARYPTFEEYAKRGNYQAGIDRCDVLLQKNGINSELLQVKLRLQLAAGQDAAPVLDQIAALKPPLLEPWDIADIERIVVESLRDTWPIPATAGPAISKLWDLAVKNVTNVNYKLEILDARFSRAIVDNRLGDAQQVLIQLKALQPKNRSFYMAHAAMTQMLSSANNDLQSRLALSLARKAVTERFDEDKSLDCRVPGQIFALQHSTEDLQGIVGRPIQESKLVFDALRIGKPAAVDGGESKPVAADASTSPPREWMMSEVSALKTQFRVLIDGAASSDLLIKFIANAIRLFHVGLTTLGLSSSRGPADACFLAISGLVKLFETSHDVVYLMQSTFLAENVLKHNPYVHEARLILVYLYMRLGLGSLAISMFDSLGVKEIQHDTVGHTLLTHISQLYPFSAQLADSVAFDSRERTLKALAVYRRHDDKLSDTAANVLKHGQTGILFDIQQLRNQLRSSVVRRLFLLEHRRIGRLSGKTAAEKLTDIDIGPRVTSNWTTTSDNRDFKATFDYGYNVERALYGWDGSSLSTKSGLLTRLLVDCIWSLAESKPLLVNDIDALLQATDDVAKAVGPSLANSSSSSIRSEYMAGSVALVLAKVLTKVAAKINVTDEEVDLIVSETKRLNIDLLIASPDVLTEHLAEHYVYLDLLRVILLACRYVQNNADQTPSKLQELQTIAKQLTSKIINHAQAQSAAVKAANIQDALLRPGPLREELDLFGSEAVSKFCEKLATSAKAGLENVAKIALVN